MYTKGTIRGVVREAVKVLLALMAMASMAPLASANVAISLDPPLGGIADKDNVWGWSFTVNESIVVTDLGVSDPGIWPGLSGEHSVGIWRMSDAALLVSGTLGPGDINTLFGYFRYTPVANTALYPGIEYVIGEYYNDPPEEDYATPSIYDVDPAINFGVIKCEHQPGGLVMPTTDFPANVFGPNFQFTLGAPPAPPAPGGSVVPAPGALLLSAVGTGLVSLLRRRGSL